VVTSFPKELTQAYKTAFEKANPGIKLEILNKNTVQGIAYVRELPAGQRPDVFWASAPDAFEVLAGQKLLDNVADLANKAAPAKVGNYPINDPQGLYLGQALAGYGLMWNTRYMAANKLPAPRQWADLMKPVYFGHVAMSSPSRSGTTHLTVETMLQGEGWDKGWSQLLQIAGNCAADHRAQLRRARRREQRAVRHRPGDRLLRPGGQVLGLSGRVRLPRRHRRGAGQHRAGGRRQERRRGAKFIAFTVSPKARSCCSTRRSRACPSCRPTRWGQGAGGLPQPFEIAKRAKVQFDSDLSEARYNVVSSMFDQTITFRLKELQAATKAIHAAEAALAKKPNPQALALLKEARTGLLAGGRRRQGGRQGSSWPCSPPARRTRR
jgi:phosphoglycerate transport regulatory protein PgtC